MVSDGTGVSGSLRTNRKGNKKVAIGDIPGALGTLDTHQLPDEKPAAVVFSEVIMCSRDASFQELSVAEYDMGWENKWDDMKIYGPFSRHLRRLILDLIRPLEFKSVLDAGCGQGALLAEIQSEFPHIRPYGIDLSGSAIALARSRVYGGEFRTLDLATEFLENKFDLVICSEVLEHIQDDVAAIRHLAAMTRKYLVVTAPHGRMRPSEVVMGHVRNYARGELARKLAQSGLRVTRTVEWGFPFYSPLYRDFLDRIGNRGTSGKYGVMRKMIAQGLYALFALNSTQRGDEVLMLAEPADAPSVG